jgi:Raf kinase inhibitor-like YbhB/YbcL family protein
MAFTLSSTDIAPGGTIPQAQIYNGMGYKGGNVSPALSWSGAPAGTRSFALMVHDPDAPTGSGWWHWVVYNIPPDTAALAAGAGDPNRNLMPRGAVQGRTDFGTPGYGGPAPPPGKPHRYYFRLFALQAATLDIPADASAAVVGFTVHAQAIGEPAVLMGLFGS